MELVSFDHFFRESDVVAIHVHLGNSTRYLI